MRGLLRGIAKAEKYSVAEPANHSDHLIFQTQLRLAKFGSSLRFATR
jgi:hypothetical protein